MLSFIEDYDVPYKYHALGCKFTVFALNKQENPHKFTLSQWISPLFFTLFQGKTGAFFTLFQDFGILKLDIEFKKSGKFFNATEEISSKFFNAAEEFSTFSSFSRIIIVSLYPK